MPHLSLPIAGVFIAAFAGWSTAEAACVPSEIAAGPERVEPFVADPAGWLGRFPNGDGGMAAEVRNLVASDPRALDAAGSIAGPADAAQRRALGAGLGQAAIVCRRSDPDFTRRIQERVVALNLPEVVAGYSAVTGETRTASVGDGAGSDGGGGGTGSTKTGADRSGGRPPPTGTTAVANAPAGFSGGSGASALGATIAAPQASFATGLNTVSPTSPAQ